MLDPLDPLKVANNVYGLIMENEKVRVLKATFKPKDKTVMHCHPDHVVYVLKGGKIKISSKEKSDEMDLKENQAIFLRSQHHEAENIGDTTIDLLVVELKPETLKV